LTWIFNQKLTPAATHGREKTKLKHYRKFLQLNNKLKH
jgi:hypothetical protein